MCIDKTRNSLTITSTLMYVSEAFERDLAGIFSDTNI